MPQPYLEEQKYLAAHIQSCGICLNPTALDESCVTLKRLSPVSLNSILTFSQPHSSAVHLALLYHTYMHLFSSALSYSSEISFKSHSPSRHPPHCRSLLTNLDDLPLSLEPFSWQSLFPNICCLFSMHSTQNAIGIKGKGEDDCSAAYNTLQETFIWLLSALTHMQTYARICT